MALAVSLPVATGVPVSVATPVAVDAAAGPVSLCELRCGAEATIASIAHEGLQARLLEMGCLPGESLTVTHRAPFGGPIAIEVFGYVLSLRKTEARAILVYPV